MHDVRVTSTHAVCGAELVGYPCVVRTPEMVVLLAGNIGIPYPRNTDPVGTGGLFYECTEEGCSSPEWTFAPYPLEELLYVDLVLVEDSGELKHHFRTEGPI